MIAAVRRWWGGTYDEEPPDSPFLLPYLRRHWTAQLVRTVVFFVAKEWKWLAGFAVAVAAVIVSVM